MLPALVATKGAGSARRLLISGMNSDLPGADCLTSRQDGRPAAARPVIRGRIGSPSFHSFVGRRLSTPVKSKPSPNRRNDSGKIDTFEVFDLPRKPRARQATLLELCLITQSDPMA